MNRKNLTAAVLAGLAGAAGIAGTAQAVNLNPDGLGQVLIYPYYTTNDGNQTLMSVVNTTDSAKAVKVRYLEGYNSREVLDFNLYLSAYDVWVAAIADDAGTPTLYIPDTSCTVPYLYGMGVEGGGTMGVQPFLPYAYQDDNEDGGPTDIARASEGHIEMIEMGTMDDSDARAPKTLGSSDPGRMGSATAATHVVTDDGPMPADCDLLVRNWTAYGSPANKDDPDDGHWYEEAVADSGQAHTGTARNSGGLFGGAAVINAAQGTMWSYDAKAVQGFDSTSDGIHYVPGTIHPSLDDGNEHFANIFFGTPSNKAKSFFYGRSVEAVSALFMHDNVMNTFSIDAALDAATEWVLTFPTKSFYVDAALTGTSSFWIPDETDAGCNGWNPGEPYPSDAAATGETDDPDWQQCQFIEIEFENVIPPFTDAFNDDGMACEIVGYGNWDREESPTTPGTPGDKPPIVSPAPPGPPPPDKPSPFELCYEVNVLRFGDNSVFGTTSDLLRTVSGTPENGWANINFSLVADFKDGLGEFERHQDRNGLVGLPVTGFSAEQYVNGFLEGGVLANYGGVFQHKASVKRIRPNRAYHGGK